MSQKKIFSSPPGRVVTSCVAAGTLITTKSLPEAQGPVTVQRKVYVPCTRSETPVLLALGLLIVGVFGPLTKVH
ncbi:hypothetical protein D3C80_1123790 [compost metagenome]